MRKQAPIFAALGDETRLALLARLSTGVPWSITELSDGVAMTRQAVTKHLRVLEGAGLVRGEALGRECRFQLEPARLAEARDYLGEVSAAWDGALERLRGLVEKG
ncbi:MAG: ArsR/SmtB family transcription factor [Chthoniobacterales bacterium]